MGFSSALTKATRKTLFRRKGDNVTQTATLKIEIPKGNLWTVSSIKKSMEKNGIKCDVTSCLNHIEISKKLREQLIKPKNVSKVKK